MELKKGDMVKHVFKKYKYKVLEIKKDKDIMDDLRETFSNTYHFKNVKCLCENGAVGWLSSEELIKIK